MNLIGGKGDGSIFYESQIVNFKATTQNLRLRLFNTDWWPVIIQSLHPLRMVCEAEEMICPDFHHKRRVTYGYH
jgi:hypothetical protein